MKTISITEARKNIYKLIDQVTEAHEPLQITGKRSNAVSNERRRLAFNTRDNVSNFNSRDERIHY